ncbi:two pore domain potassium channel family protein [Mycobacterium eburneum]|nr:potassium channel family protein [Mycobacterium eburneum]TDH50791.1 two pore domain potassium channel family protein [Mycobacterium eburneum]
MNVARASLDRWERRAEWPLAAVAFTFLAAYSIDVLVQPRGQSANVIDALIKAAWIAFAIDYGVRLWLAPDRRHWFVRHLLDLAVVVLPLLRPLRLVRLVILVSTLHRAVGNAIRGRVMVYTVAGALLLVYVAALATLQTERQVPDAKITNFGQALWWSISTVTTVNYGDEYPVTNVGRAIAVFLMIGGISLLGTITATIASWIVQRVAEEDVSGQAITVSHIDELRGEIQALRDQLREATDGQNP